MTKMSVNGECIGMFEGAENALLNWNSKGLKQLPAAALVYLERIEVILAKWNYLMDLPEWIGNLKNLTTLDFTQNGIEVLPKTIGLLGHLEKLCLKHNSLKKLPKEIGAMRNLKIIDLEDNKINFLPTEIYDLKSLEILNLRHNKLKQLPALIQKLRSLRELILDYNNLTELPLDIVYLPNLTYLSASGNSLTHLPYLYFQSKPTVKVSCNFHLNYLSYEMGNRMAMENRRTQNIWEIDFLGCGEYSMIGGKPLSKEENPLCILILVPSHQQVIALPKIIQKVFNDKDDWVISLYEHALREAYNSHYSEEGVKNPEICELPRFIHEILMTGPVSKCHHCLAPIFTECVLWLYPKRVVNPEKRLNMSGKVIVAVLFCTTHCSRDFRTHERLGPISETNIGEKLLPWQIFI